MQSLQTIKRRLKGVKSIGQITKAMELVAATKMRRSQEIALLSRPYAFSALELLANVSEAAAGYKPKLLEKRAIATTAVVVIASDKGLTGSFNSAVFRAFEKFLKKEEGNNLATRSPSGDLVARAAKYIAVGQKAVSYIERRTGGLEASFTKFADFIAIEEVRPLADVLINGYLEGRWDRVVILSANFKSALSQTVIERQILPVEVESLKQTAEEIIPKTGRFADTLRESGVGFFQTPLRGSGERDYIIEPSSGEVLDQLVPFLVLMQAYHIILEANASEHAARRLAMKSASDNAKDILNSLTLEFNKSRQAGITRELIEITAGAGSIKS